MVGIPIIDVEYLVTTIYYCYLNNCGPVTNSS